MNAIVSRRAIVLMSGVLALLSIPSPAADPLSEEESEKLLDEVSEPLPGFQSCVRSFAFSPDGGTLVGVGGPWGKRTGSRRTGQTLESNAEYVVWQTATWEFERRYKALPDRSIRKSFPRSFGPGPGGQPLHSSFLDHGRRLAIVTDAHQLRMFRNESRVRNKNKSWIQTQSLSLAKSGSGFPGLCHMQVSPDERWLAFPIRPHGEGSLVEIWKITPAPRNANTEPALSHHQTIKHADCDMGFGLGGTILVTVGSDAIIRLWNPDTGELNREFSFGDELPKALKQAAHFDDRREIRHQCQMSVSPDGHTLAVTCNGIVRLYDLVANRWKTHHHVARSQSKEIYFHPSGRWLVSLVSKSLPGQKTMSDHLILWSAPRLNPELDMELPRGMTSNHFMIEFSPDGKLMVSGGDRPLRWSFEKLAKAANAPAKP